MKRRQFFSMFGSGLLTAASSRAAADVLNSPARAPVSMAEAFDREMNSFMAARAIPGGALAVMKSGRLVYAQGYGWSDRENLVPMEPQSLFRIASVSKPITATVVMRSVEKRRLGLEDRVINILQRIPGWRATDRPRDGRWDQITIRHLLQHTGGWDRERSFDPMFRSREIATHQGQPGPATPIMIIRYMLEQPLDFAPGQRYAYSNFGYCLLGRVLEVLSGQPYETWVQKSLLKPLGIQSMRIGFSRESERVPGEVRYYTPDHAVARTVFPDGPQEVPWPYGGFYLEAMDAHGGWIASVLDLARFVVAADGLGNRPVLQPATRRTILAPPNPPVARKADGALENTYYSCGWMVRRIHGEKDHNLWHTGSLPGTFTLVVRRWDGLSWVALFNQRSEDAKKPDLEIDPALHRAADAVTDWPKNNLFDTHRRRS